MGADVRATFEGFGSAIDKGMSQWSKCEREATGRKNEVSDVLALRYNIKDGLMKLGEELSAIDRC